MNGCYILVSVDNGFCFAACWYKCFFDIILNPITWMESNNVGPSLSSLAPAPHNHFTN